MRWGGGADGGLWAHATAGEAWAHLRALRPARLRGHRDGAPMCVGSGGQIYSRVLLERGARSQRRQKTVDAQLKRVFAKYFVSWGFCTCFIILGKCHFLDIWGFLGRKIRSISHLFYFPQANVATFATFSLFHRGKCRFQMSRQVQKGQLLRVPCVPAQSS